MLKKILPLPNNTQGPYRHAQLLGLNIFTTPDPFGHCSGPKCYLGKNDIDDDVRHRVRILERALESVYTSDRWDQDPTTLKVFMAPEFFFRGPQGAYHASPILEGSLRLGELLEELFEQERWEHWLFVPGTIVAAEPTGSRKDHEILYFNVAPIYKGNSKTKFLHFKETVATIDFLEMNSTKDDDIVPKPTQRTYSELPPWMDRHLNRAGYQYVRNSTFTVSGLTIGIEICADHGGSTLAGQHSGMVHLHLIVSGGMSIAKGPVITPPGGPIFLVDGFGRTEVARNLFGTGLMYSENAEQGRDLYNVGPVHWAGLHSSLRLWLGRVVFEMTGSLGAVPTGFSAFNEGSNGLHRISALGPNWKQHMKGLFVTKPYEMEELAYRVLHKELRPVWNERRKKRQLRGLELMPEPRPPATEPTVDCYPPMRLVELQPRRAPQVPAIVAVQD